MKLSELLTYYRHRDNLSLESVGDYAGVSKSTVKRWESGRIEQCFSGTSG